MHKGARFYRCDFQVHTPRDRNWQGTRPTSEAERQQWAVALVSACRQKALDAIAITDHHDLVMFPYVRAAAEAEVGADGQRLPAERRLVVFPGIEVTLALPCQVIVLFDADLPLDHIAHLPGALGYEPAAPSESMTAATTKLALAHPNDVIACLEKFTYLKGRFIVLPHVQENGHKTFLRSGFDKHYIAFQGVGGYVDGDAPDPKTGARKILDGLDPAYGKKPLAILQTSDNRHADNSLLGKHSTWVKWSRPTAEAIRQSCLARQSRVSQVLPQLPAVAITRIEVSASKFLGKQNVFLSPQYNALIGGRGTGKSTLLEYARWALCANSSAPDAESNSIPDYERRRRRMGPWTWGRCTQPSASSSLRFEHRLMQQQPPSPMLRSLNASARRTRRPRRLFLKPSPGSQPPALAPRHTRRPSSRWKPCRSKWPHSIIDSPNSPG
jgi:type III restriction enzyme